MISLVEGAPGGNRTPSPIMGHTGDVSDGAIAPTAPAPQSEVAAQAKEEVRPPEPKPAPRRETAPAEKLPDKPVPVPEKKPEPPAPEPPKVEEPKPAEPSRPQPPKPEPPKPQPPKPEAKKPEPKKPDVKKPEPAKAEPVTREPKKPEPKKPDVKKPAPKKQPARQDPIAAALQQARKATSRASSGDRGNAVEQALAEARKNAGGNRGGGGGEGQGPGGGGLGDVYIGQVMLAVRPNWGYASVGRKSLVCVVKVKVDLQGNVLLAEISRSSGNAQYDASAVNAVVRTGQAGDFPAPPNQSYTDLDLVFTLDELMGR